MKDIVVPLAHLLTTIAKLLGPGGAKAVLAENVVLKQQLLLVTRSRRRGPHLGAMDSLVDRHRLIKLAPSPDEPARGVLDDWLFFHVGEVQEAGKRGAYANRYSTGVADVFRIKARARETLFARWQIVDRHLAEHGPFHLGDRFSLVDLYLLTTAAWFEMYSGSTANEARERRLEFGLDDLPAVKRCFELVAARPKCAPIIERHIKGVRSLMARSLPE